MPTNPNAGRRLREQPTRGPDRRTPRAVRKVLHAGEILRRPAHRHPAGRARRRRLLPRPVEPRQGRALHPRRQLHGVLLVEDLCQRRDHHLGEPGDRLPVRRPRPPRIRTAWLSAWCRVLVVHLFADAGASPVCPGRAGRNVPGSQGALDRSGAGLGRRGVRPRPAPPIPAGAGQGWVGARHLGRGHRDDRRGARAHHQDLRSGPHRRLLADPGDVDGQPRGRLPFRGVDRRGDDVVL